MVKVGSDYHFFNKLLSFFDAHGLVDWSATALEGINIRALRCAAGAQKKHPDITTDNSPGSSHGGFGTKIYLATDGSGLPLNIVLSPGQAHESQFAQRLLDGIGVQRHNVSMKRRGHAVLADKACSGHALRNELKSKAIKPSFPENQMKKRRQMVVHGSIVMLTAIATLLNVVLAA